MGSMQESFINKEKKAVEELQSRIENFLTPAIRDDDSFLYRFLKARDFDVYKAEKMIQKHLIWRKIYQIDTILEDFEPIEFFLNFLEPSFIGYDKEGNMVRYSATGKLNPFDIMKCMTMSCFMKHWFWSSERNYALLKEENAKTGRDKFRTLLIMDLDKITFMNATSRVGIDMFIQFVKNYQDNNPERMQSVYAINAPSFYALGFSLFKTLMSNSTISRIHIFGHSGWKEKLLEVIDADTLPVFLGGNRTDPDGNPMCTTFINHCGKIPEFYFLSEKDRYFKDKTGVKMLVVQPREKEEINLEVENVGSLLQWEFLVKGKDIGFGILFEASKHEVIEVMPFQKYTTSDGKEKDSFKCRFSGKYIIVFDNSYSWRTSKEVQYRIRIVKPT